MLTQGMVGSCNAWHDERYARIIEVERKPRQTVHKAVRHLHKGEEGEQLTHRVTLEAFSHNNKPRLISILWNQATTSCLTRLGADERNKMLNPLSYRTTIDNGSSSRMRVRYVISMQKLENNRCECEHDPCW